MLKVNHIYQGNCLDILKTFPDNCIDCVVTSPPYYGLRSYGTKPQVWDNHNSCKHDFEIREHTKSTTYNKGFNERWGNAAGQRKQEVQAQQLHIKTGYCSLCHAWCGELGQEPNFNMFIDHLVEIFMECARVLKRTGSMWINIADSHDKNKSLLGIPERLAIALTDRGLLRRNSVIWHKLNCLPLSAKDRFTNDFEYFYFFTKSPKYYFKQQFEPLKTESKKRAMRGSSGKGKYANGEQFPEGVHAMTMSQEREHQGYDNMEEKIASGQTLLNPMGRNKRTVWEIPQEYSMLRDDLSIETKNYVTKRLLEAGLI